MKDKKESAIEAAPDYQEYEGRGLEHAPPPTTPALKIVHGLEKDFGKAHTPLQDASPGQIIYTADGRLYDAIQITPVTVIRYYTEWDGTQAENGQVVARYAENPGNTKLVEGRGVCLPGGHPLVQTLAVYGVFEWEKGEFQPAVMYFQRTALKVGRDWLQRMRQLQPRPGGSGRYLPPIFARRYVFGTVRTENQEHAWWTWQIKAEPEWNAPGGPAFIAAVSASELLDSAARQMLASTMSADWEEAPVEDDMSF